MVKVNPALPYLDVVRQVRDATTLTVCAYNVSGEYAMLKATAAAGMLDEQRAVLELLTSIRRAGADSLPITPPTRHDGSADPAPARPGRSRAGRPGNTLP